MVVLLAAGPFVSRYVNLVGFEKAAWSSAAAVVSGLAVYSLFGRLGYEWVAIALVLVSAGMGIDGVVAGTNVLRGLPDNRTSIGAALVDTATEVASGVGIAVAGLIIAAFFTGSIVSGWNTQQAAEFERAVMIAGLVLAGVAAALVGGGFLRSRGTSQSDRSQTLSAAARHDPGT